MSLRSLRITEADRDALLGMLCSVKVLTRSLRQPKGIIKDRRWSQKNGKQIPLFGLYFIPADFFFFFFFSLTCFPSPNALWVCGRQAIKKLHVSQHLRTKGLMMSPSYQPLSFDYSTIILYPCKSEWQGMLNKAHNTQYLSCSETPVQPVLAVFAWLVFFSFGFPVASYLFLLVVQIVTRVRRNEIKIKGELDY